MNEALSGGGLFLLRTVLSLASFLFLLRFLLQAVRADFYNPLTQGVLPSHPGGSTLHGPPP